MIGAALVFGDPAMYGLPRARGILGPADADALTRQSALARDACEASVMVGAIGTPRNFLKIFYFPVHYARN
jgi:hypothetical protein